MSVVGFVYCWSLSIVRVPCWWESQTACYNGKSNFVFKDILFIYLFWKNNTEIFLNPDTLKNSDSVSFDTKYNWLNFKPRMNRSLSYSTRRISNASVIWVNIYFNSKITTICYTNAMFQSYSKTISSTCTPSSSSSLKEP